MAQTMICDGCGEREAVVMITQIGTGDIQAFDPWCGITWFETAAALMRQALDLPPADQEGTEPAKTELEQRTCLKCGQTVVPLTDAPGTTWVLQDAPDMAAAAMCGKIGGHVVAGDTADTATSTADSPSGATMSAGQPARADATQEG